MVMWIPMMMHTEIQQNAPRRLKSISYMAYLGRTAEGMDDNAVI
jgi:hypothetical protein